MKKFHVHVYEIARKMEVDVDAKTEVDAKTHALRLAKENALATVKSDCKFISLSFEMDEKGNGSTTGPTEDKTVQA